MRRAFHFGLVAGLALWGLAFLFPRAQALESASGESRTPTLLLISIDGVRADQINASLTPHIDALAAKGVKSAMLPVWPSLTHPNHWTLVTGLYPEHSGVIANEMYDSISGKEYSVATRTDPDWFRGEPIWATVTRQGGRAGVFGSWIGARVTSGPNRPAWFVPYSPTDVANDHRGEIIAALIDQEPSVRPNYVSLYIGEVDSTAHGNGPHAPETKAALAAADRQIGEIVRRLDARGMLDMVNIIIVSDHGMSDVGSKNVVYLDEIIPAAMLSRPPLGAGANSYLWPKPGMEQAVRDRVNAASPHIHAVRGSDVPAIRRWQYPGRVPPLVLTADPGWVIHIARDAEGFVPKGQHGYAPELPDMHAVFVAAGPGIHRGAKLAPFANVNLYALMAKLLRVQPANNDGSLHALCPILVDPDPACG